METPAPTIQNIIVDSLSQRPIADGTFNKIYAIKAPDGLLDDYLLRARKPGLDYLKSQLNQTTALTPPHLAALTVPDFLFMGPNVSQSLLHLGIDEFYDPFLEIIPKQQGTPLFKYIEGPDEKNDATTQHAKRIELIKELSKPESTELEKLIMQAAFVATQRPSFPFLDINGGSILLDRDEKGILHLHLLDVVGQETIDRDGVRNFGQPPEYNPHTEATAPPASSPQRKSLGQRIKSVFAKRNATPPEAIEPLKIVTPADIESPAEMKERVQKWMDKKWEERTKDNKMFRYLAYDPYREPNPAPFQGITTFLNDYLLQGMTEQDEDVYKAFRKKLAGALGAVGKKWQDTEMPAEWKGFQRMTKPEGHEVGIPDPLHMEPAELISPGDDQGKIKARQVSAVKLSDTPLALKHTLDQMRSLSVINER